MVECKGYGNKYPVLTRSIITDIVDQINYDDFTFDEMMGALIDEVKNQYGYIITYYC